MQIHGTPPAAPPRLLLTVTEAAAALGIGRTRTFALIRSGELESVKIGTRRLVPIEVLDEYVARLRRQR